MGKGNIIILNGVSSTGKTTLSRALQDSLEEPYHLINADTFIDMCPRNFSNRNGFKYAGRDAMKAMCRTIITYSDMGLNVISDNLYGHIEHLEDSVTAMYKYPVLFVYVTCPLDELRKREKERGNRKIGIAEEQLETIVPKDISIYDVVVDTHNETQNECVTKIINALKYPDNFTAFKTLWSQRNE